LGIWIFLEEIDAWKLGLRHLWEQILSEKKKLPELFCLPKKSYLVMKTPGHGETYDD
jgi:hypothetical protein